MYLPAAFSELRTDVLHDVMRRYSFATLLSTDGRGAICTSALPLLLDIEPSPFGRLIGHLARPNEQVTHLREARELLCLFQGPHAYISPSWYATNPSVPTWNYVIVTARGAATLIEDPCAVRKVLERTVAAYEPPDSDWTMRNLHENYVRSMAAGVVAFEIPIRSLEGKFKLNQNRSAADQRQVIERLESGDANAKAVAQLMRSGKDTSVA